MRNVKNITACVTPQIDRQARPLAAESETTTASSRNVFEKCTLSPYPRGPQNVTPLFFTETLLNSLFINVMPTNAFVFNRLRENKRS